MNFVRNRSLCFVILFFSIVPVRSLSLTEIFFDGTDEWIEITTDAGESFSGTIYLSGVKKSPVPLSLNLGPNEAIVLADKGEMLTDQVSYKKEFGRNFPDTKAIHRTIQDGSGIVIDAITVSKETVMQANNHKASLTRIKNDRTETTESIGLLTGYFGTPGNITDTIQTATTTTGTVSNNTGSVTIGTIFTGCETNSTWRITEVFRGSDTMSPFVELQTNQITDSVDMMLSGDMMSATHLTLSGQRYPGDYLVVSWGSLGVISDTKTITLPSKNQIGTGFIQISRQSGQVLDRVSVGPVTSHSQNFVGQQCGRILDSQNMSTPGYPTAITAYMKPTITKAPKPCPATPTPRPIVSLDGLWPAPPSGTPEQIAITIHDSKTHNLTKYYILKNGSSKRYLHGPSAGTGSIVLTGNFALPNDQNTCVELYSDHDEWLDRLCYQKEQTSDGIRIGNGENPRFRPSVEQTGSVSEISSGSTGIVSGSTFSGSVTIQSILYDPLGSDKGKEKITILNESNTVFEDGDLRILIGEKKTKRYLRRDVAQGSVTISGSFSFPNSTSTCVELHHKDGILDMSCYTVAKKVKIKAPTSKSTTSSKPAKIKIINLVYDPKGSDTNHESITLMLTGIQNSVNLAEYTLLVGTTRKKLTGTLDRAKPLTITKTRGFPNTKPSCATLLYGDRPIDYYCRGPKKTKTITKKVKIKTTPSERLYRDYIKSLHQHLARKRPEIYYQTDVAQHVQLYKNIYNAHKNQSNTITIHNQTFPLNTPIEELRTAQQEKTYYDIFLNTIIRPLKKK